MLNSTVEIELHCRWRFVSFCSKDGTSRDSRSWARHPKPNWVSTRKPDHRAEQSDDDEHAARDVTCLRFKHVDVRVFTLAEHAPPQRPQKPPKFDIRP